MSEIIIEQKGENFIITKNKNFEFIVNKALNFTELIIQKSDDKDFVKIWHEKIMPTFIIKLTNKSEKEAVLVLEDLMWFKGWIDIVCKTLIEIDIDTIKEQKLKYLATSETLMTQLKKYIPEIINNNS